MRFLSKRCKQVFLFVRKEPKKHFTNKSYRSNKIVFYMIFLRLKKCFNFLFYLYIQMRMLF